jgi:hypothetical protein
VERRPGLSHESPVEPAKRTVSGTGFVTPLDGEFAQDAPLTSRALYNAGAAVSHCRVSVGVEKSVRAQVLVTGANTVLMLAVSTVTYNDTMACSALCLGADSGSER